ncbi:MAG: hypothetical protein ACLQPN_14275 [Bryobacteraceae bacterium]
MYTIGSFWGEEPAVVKLILLGLFAVVLTSAIRFSRLVRHLYRYPGEPISREKIARGEAEPGSLATYALGSRAPLAAVPEKCFDSGALAERPVPERTLYGLRAAEATFLYLWEGCSADVESTKRASLLTFLLSLAMAAFDASPTFDRYFNSGKRTGSTCLFLTVEHLLALLALGWSCCATLYFASSFFERALARRKAGWKYFCAGIRHEVSV